MVHALHEVLLHLVKPLFGKPFRFGEVYLALHCTHRLWSDVHLRCKADRLAGGLGTHVALRLLDSGAALRHVRSL